MSETDPEHPLTAWLDRASPPHALVLEDGSTGSVSPLIPWLADLRDSDRPALVAVHVGPADGLVVERHLIRFLFRALFPDDLDDLDEPHPLDYLRGHVCSGLRTKSDDPRPIVFDRLNWAETSFAHHLDDLLRWLRPEQKVVVSLRTDDGTPPNIVEWCRHLGWDPGNTHCLHLAAGLGDYGPSPIRRAEAWVASCAQLPAVLRLLDLLASALRPLQQDEVAHLLRLPPGLLSTCLDLVPAGAVLRDRTGALSLYDPTCGPAWCLLRPDAAGALRGHLRRLAESALAGAASDLPPYVVQHYGALSFDADTAASHAVLVSAAWQAAWLSVGDPLGFEADTDRLATATRRQLAEDASATIEQRAALLLTLYRCRQVSLSVLDRETGSNNTGCTRASILLALADHVEEPLRSESKRVAVDILLTAAELSVGEVDLLAGLAASIERTGRAPLVERVLAWYRGEIADGCNSLWLLRAAPLVPPSEVASLCDEALRKLRDLDDAWALRDGLAHGPLCLASHLLPGARSLPPVDRFRFLCALAPYLTGASRRSAVEELLALAGSGGSWLSLEDLEAVVPSLETEDIVRLWHTLEAVQATRGQGLCLRSLFTRGEREAARRLVSRDPGSLPYEWLLPLAAFDNAERAALGIELASRLAAMEEIPLAWTLVRDASDLVRALGADALLRAARSVAPNEEAIVARLALVPLVAEPEKRALAAEAVAIVRRSLGDSPLHEDELLAHHAWLSEADACFLLALPSDFLRSALDALPRLVPLLRRLGGEDLPGKIVAQMLEVGTWAP